MFIPIYLLSLGVSAGIVGVFGQRLLDAQGFVPDFETGIIVSAAVACVYAALQLLYMALLRLLKPTNAPGPLLGESLSNAAVLVLVPHLANLDIPWPYSILHRVEPLIFLGLFGGLHGFFKLFSLFAATQSKPGPRFVALFWTLGAMAALLGGAYAYAAWSAALDASRIGDLSSSAAFRIGTVHAKARAITEGMLSPFDISGREGQDLVFRFAYPAEAAGIPEETHLVLRFANGESPPLRSTLELDNEHWHELRLPAAKIPDGCASCTITWSEEEEPVWVAYTGLRPVAVSSRQLLVSGPFYHLPQSEYPPHSVLLLLVEGLGAEHMKRNGYHRSPTPFLDRFAEESVEYPFAYTPCPRALPAAMTLLTGRDPLDHGYLAGERGPLPEGALTLAESLHEAGYVTAAFTEGDSVTGEDLAYGSGAERGFELFDAHFPIEAAPGGQPGPPVPRSASVTLGKAAKWAAEYAAHPFFLFVRIRELEQPRRLPRYGEGFLGRGRTPTPRDIYDTALLDVDKHVGGFIEQIQASCGFEKLCFLITSTNGYDFTEPGRALWRRGGQPKRTLTEYALRVPLLMRMPGKLPRRHNERVSLENVAATVLDRLGLEAGAVGGTSIFEFSGSEEPVAMMGSPVALALRTHQWLFVWQSGRDPFTLERLEPARPLNLLDLDRYRRGVAQPDNIRRNPNTVAGLEKRLETFLRRHTRPAF